MILLDISIFTRILFPLGIFISDFYPFPTKKLPNMFIATVTFFFHHFANVYITKSSLIFLKLMWIYWLFPFPLSKILLREQNFQKDLLGYIIPTVTPNLQKTIWQWQHVLESECRCYNKGTLCFYPTQVGHIFFSYKWAIKDYSLTYNHVTLLLNYSQTDKHRYTFRSKHLHVVMKIMVIRTCSIMNR